MPTHGTDSTVEGPWVVSRIRVTYADTDQMGHVYYGNYLVYFEIARTEWMRVLGLTYAEFEKSGFFVPVAEAHVKYLGRTFYDDLLEVRAAMREIGKTRVQFVYEIHRTGEEKLLATGQTIHAVLNSEGRAIRIPPMLRELIAKLEPLPGDVEPPLKSGGNRNRKAGSGAQR